MVFPLIFLISSLLRPQGHNRRFWLHGVGSSLHSFWEHLPTTVSPVSSVPLSFQRQKGEGTGTLVRGWDIPTGASLALAIVVLAPPQRMTEKRQRSDLGSCGSQVSLALWCPSWERGLGLRSSDSQEQHTSSVGGTQRFPVLP